MSTGMQIIITIVAIMAIIVTCWSISDAHDKICRMGEIKKEKGIYEYDMQYWKNKYWELHKLHYEKDEVSENENNSTNVQRGL